MHSISINIGILITFYKAKISKYFIICEHKRTREVINAVIYSCFTSLCFWKYKMVRAFAL